MTTAASEAIFFIGAMLIAAALVATFGNVVSDIGDGIRERGTTFSRELKSDISVVNDPQSMTTSPLTLYVKNTGSTTLHTSTLDVLLDGQISTSLTHDVLGSTNDQELPRSKVDKVTVNDLSVASGDHRVRVVTEFGNEALLEFFKA